jgi:O-antigen/teichoic acid export membrane protein
MAANFQNGTLKWRPGAYLRSSGRLFAWLSLRVAAQAAIVLLLARELGAHDYGAFVTVIAIASFLSPFVGLGLSNMVLRNTPKDPEHMAVYVGRAVKWWNVTLVPGIASAILIALFLLPDGLPRWAAFAMIVGEFAGSSLTELSARCKQSEGKVGRYGATSAGLPLVRLCALGGLFIVAGNPGIESVLWTYTGCSLAYALYLYIPLRASTRNGFGLEPMPATAGLPFSLAAFAVRLQQEFNKPVLASLGFGLAGTYNVAQRTVDLAALPLVALQEALWPRLYAQQNPTPQLRRTGLGLLALAFVGGAALWAVAPVVPLILGPSFHSAGTIVRALAWLPLLQALRGLVNFQAIQTNRMSLIGWAYGVGAVLNVALVTGLVPRWGLGGAVIAAYATEAATTSVIVLGYNLTRPSVAR